MRPVAATDQQAAWAHSRLRRPRGPYPAARWSAAWARAASGWIDAQAGLPVPVLQGRHDLRDIRRQYLSGGPAVSGRRDPSPAAATSGWRAGTLGENLATIWSQWGEAVVASERREARPGAPAPRCAGPPAGVPAAAAGRNPAARPRAIAAAALDIATDAHRALDYEVAMWAACLALDAITATIQAQDAARPGWPGPGQPGW
jgi:hypothetical protein